MTPVYHLCSSTHRLHEQSHRRMENSISKYEILGSHGGEDVVVGRSSGL
jgi:hypothetical protein